MYDSIIHQTFQNLNPEILDNFLNSFFKNNLDLITLLDFSKEYYADLVLQFVSSTLEVHDELLYQSQKNKKRYRMHSYRTRTIETDLGVISFSRRYYFDTLHHSYVHLLDEQLELEPYHRFTQDVRMKCIEQATEFSYRKTAELSQTNVTHTSVRNWVLDFYEKTNDSELFLNESIDKSNSKLVFVEADEDHVVMKNGKHRILKLVYIHEGYENKNGRNQIVCPFRNHWYV